MKLQLMCFVFLTVLLSCSTSNNNTSVSENAALGAPDAMQISFSNQYPRANNINWARFNSNAAKIFEVGLY